MTSGVLGRQLVAEQHVVGVFLHGEPVLVSTDLDAFAFLGREAQEYLSATSATPMRVRCCHARNLFIARGRYLASQISRRVEETDVAKLVPRGGVLR